MNNKAASNAPSEDFTRPLNALKTASSISRQLQHKKSPKEPIEQRGQWKHATLSEGSQNHNSHYLQS